MGDKVIVIKGGRGPSIREVMDNPELLTDEQRENLAESLRVFSECISRLPTINLSLQMGEVFKALSRLHRREQHQVSPYFSENPEACRRFREWVETSEETRGKSGRWTVSRLSEVLLVSWKAADGFYKNPETITVFAARVLRDVLGEEAFCNLVNGDGAYDRQVAEESKRRDIEAVSALLNGLVSKLSEAAPDRVREARALLELAFTMVESKLA